MNQTPTGGTPTPSPDAGEPDAAESTSGTGAPHVPAPRAALHRLLTWLRESGPARLPRPAARRWVTRPGKVGPFR